MNKSRAYRKIQHKAAQHVMKISKRDPITPLLKEPHWLPVKYRIQYKLSTAASRHFDGTLPPYLSPSLTIYQPSRSVRSSTERLLKMLKKILQTFSERSFSYTAPAVWNSLPADVIAFTHSPNFPLSKLSKQN